MSEWSVIVFSRTYQADYRFLVIPDDFDQEEQNWAEKYIISLINYSDELLDNPRWTMFKNEKHLVFGVGCMKAYINTDQMTDKYNRPIAIFIGYVAQVNNQSKFDDIPYYSGTDIDLFKPVYQLVANQWMLTSSQIIINKVQRYPYNYMPKQNIKFTNNYQRDYNQIESYLILNENSKKIAFWPEQKYNFWLWETASKIANYPEKSFSLCLGLSSKQYILKTLFLNATAKDIQSERILLNKHENEVNKNPNISSEAISPQEKPKFFELLRQKIINNGLIIIPVLTMMLGIIIIIADGIIIIKILMFGIVGLSLAAIVKKLDQMRSQKINK